MRFDISYPLDQKAIANLESLVPQDGVLSRIDLFGHIGTHLDLMGKDYPEAYFVRKGRLFDVRGIAGRDIAVEDIDLSPVGEGEFVIFNTGCLASRAYGTKEYIFAPIQLSWDLIQSLTARQVSLIGVDLSGVRLPGEHPEADRLCAEAGTFIVENLYDLDGLGETAGCRPFAVHTYPLRLEGATGLPCRVIAEL